MPSKRTSTRIAKAPIIDTTQDNLVIVESPAKAKTIKKYLGKGFEVAASMGHIVDLAKGNDAIDKKNGFAPTYVPNPDKKKVLTALKKASKTMKKIWLATDEDREGEAIAWHICRSLNLDIDTTPRIVFREITKDAITQAVTHPRTLDMDLVNAQQARRVLDRLVGFDLSPILRKKIKGGLSAGRVQSVAVKLLVEKERKIQAFTPVSSFAIAGVFETDKKEILTAKGDYVCKSSSEAEAILGSLKSSSFEVGNVEKKPGKKNPSPPFTTSSLQQAASSKLGFSVSRTMQLAQRLYEAGHITYMRTDSVALSKQAIGSAKSVITKKFGADYSHTRQFATKSKGAQQAHECIRPTNFSQENAGTDESQKKLYHLIRQRTLASQMSPASVEKTTIHIDISESENHFVAKGEVVTFEGFLKVYEGQQKKDQGFLPNVKVGEHLQRQTITAHQQFSKPPARYTEASLVKKLEELGIGRPSTYAPTISTIQRRGYVEVGIDEGVLTDHIVLTLDKDTISKTVQQKKLRATKGKLIPTDVGIVVTDFLSDHFPSIMDYQFTAKVELEFDHIAHGEIKRQSMIEDFYTPFSKTVLEVDEYADRASGERVLGEHPANGRIVKVRIGRYGPLVQIGEQGDEDIQYASLPHGLHIETVSLDEALEAFALPRMLGDREGKSIKVNIGRFGPYVQRGSTFASLKQPDDPYDVVFDRAVELIQEKIQKDKERLLQTFTYDDKEGVIMKGRWGPFIKWNRKNIKLPKGVDGATISQDEIETYIQNEVGKKKTVKKKKTKKKQTKKK